MKVANKLKTTALMLAMFFNPLGFDALFKLVMDWTGSYWITDAIFYGISLTFLGFYIYLSKYVKHEKAHN
jgi:hypothetical protein